MGFPVFIKAGRRRISVAKEIREVSRLRLRHERSFEAAVFRIFVRVGNNAADEYTRSGGVSGALVGIERDLEAIFRAQYSEIVDVFAQRVYDGRKAERFSQLIFQFYERNGAAKVANISNTTRGLILNAIVAADREGLGVDKAAKLIKERTSGAIGRARAATIARTETHAAASYATHEATREMGIPNQRKRWVSVGDARTRSHHRAANGQEVGMDEPFIIRYLGQEIKMMHPHDGNGGAANNVNCRCVAIYIADEDAIFEDWDVEPVPQPVDVLEVVIAPPPPQISDPFAIGAVFVRPITNGIRGHNLSVPSASTTEKTMRKLVKEDIDHPNNINVGINWTSRNAGDLGEFSIGSASDEAYAFTAQAIQETNYIAQYIGVGRVRGVKPTTKSDLNGSMGGGVMALNPKAMDAYTIDRRGDAMADALRKDPDELYKEISILRGEREALAGEGRAARLNGDYDRYDELISEQLKLNKRIGELVDEYELVLEIRSRGGALVASAYKIGDDLKTRPWSTKEYFTDGLDKTRALIYHEFGHHVHQSYKLTERYVTGRTPLEARLNKFWLQTPRAELDYYAPSTYAMANEREYFVETFALHMLGKTDVAHPKMIELIEEILNERGK